MAETAKRADREDTPPEKDYPVEENPPTKFDAQDLRAWWNLTGDGKQGKTSTSRNSIPENEWTEENTAALANIVIASHRSGCDIGQLKKFLKSFGSEAKKNLAAHPELPPSVTKIFVHDSAVSVRRALAGREDLPLDVQQVLAADPNPNVNAVFSHNKFVSEESLMTLHRTRFGGLDNKKHETYQVSRTEMGIAANPNCPEELLTHYLQSSNPMLVGAAVKNPKVHGRVLSEVLRKNLYHLTVVEGVLQNPNLLPGVADENVRTVLQHRQMVRNRPDVGEETKFQVSGFILMAFVGGTPHRVAQAELSTETLDEVYREYRRGNLGTDYCANSIILDIAENRKTSTQVLENLVELCSGDVSAVPPELVTDRELIITMAANQLRHRRSEKGR